MPGGRKVHLNATPVQGGIAIFIGSLVAALANYSLFIAYWPLLLISLCVLSVGIVDDVIDLSARKKMLYHGLLVVLFMVITDTKISSLGNLLGYGDIQLGWFSYPFTLFCLLAGINAINMIDGIDGLAGGLILIPLAFVAGAMFFAGDETTALLASVVCMSLVAFLITNYRFPWRKRADSFLGDSGSTFLGFLLAYFLIKATQGEQSNIALPPVVALWLLAIPLIDSGAVILNRKLQGRPPMAPARDHIHHRLMNMGFTVTRTALSLHSLALCTSLIGVIGFIVGIEEWMLLVLMLSLFIMSTYSTNRIPISASGHVPIQVNIPVADETGLPGLAIALAGSADIEQRKQRAA